MFPSVIPLLLYPYSILQLHMAVWAGYCQVLNSCDKDDIKMNWSATWTLSFTVPFLFILTVTQQVAAVSTLNSCDSNDTEKGANGHRSSYHLCISHHSFLSVYLKYGAVFFVNLLKIWSSFFVTLLEIWSLLWESHA